MVKTKKCTLLDKLLQDKWFDDENEIIPWILKRDILVDNCPAYSLKQMINCDSTIRIKEYYKRKYVNKGGLKLENALIDFNLNVKNKIVLDCGASTGGFTDCLIQCGAETVYAVDGGFGQLAGKLLNNPKVVNMEKTNLCDDILKQLSPKPEIITLDLNNFSLRQGILQCKEILKNNGIIVALIKPIYEVESKEIRRNGLINDITVIKETLRNLCGYFIENGVDIFGLTYSKVRGNAGTIEYFAHLGVNADLNDGAISLNINQTYCDCIEKIAEKSFALQKFDKNSFNPFDNV